MWDLISTECSCESAASSLRNLSKMTILKARVIATCEVQSSQNSALVSSLCCRKHFQFFVFQTYFIRSERAFVEDTRTFSLRRQPTICGV